MIISANSISNTVPFKTAGTIPVDSFDRFMDECAEECFAREPVAFDATLSRKKNGILLTLTIRAALWLDCIRCNKRDPADLDFNAEMLLVASEDSPKVDEVILGADDLDVSFYEKGNIELDRLVFEAIWSEIDSHHLCSDDCLGLCPSCGKNLNEGSCSCNR